LTQNDITRSTGRPQVSAKTADSPNFVELSLSRFVKIPLKFPKPDHDTNQHQNLMMLVRHLTRQKIHENSSATS